MEPLSFRHRFSNKIALDPITNNNGVEGLALLMKQIASPDEQGGILFRIETTDKQDHSIGRSH
jgi:hypothetical protein